MAAYSISVYLCCGMDMDRKEGRLQQRFCKPSRHPHCLSRACLYLSRATAVSLRLSPARLVLSPYALASVTQQTVTTAGWRACNRAGESGIAPRSTMYNTLRCASPPQPRITHAQHFLYALCGALALRYCMQAARVGPLASRENGGIVSKRCASGNAGPLVRWAWRPLGNTGGRPLRGSCLAASFSRLSQGCVPAW